MQIFLAHLQTWLRIGVLGLCALAVLGALIGLGLAFGTLRHGLDLSDAAFNYLAIHDAPQLEFALRFQGFALWVLDWGMGGSLTGMRGIGTAISAGVLGGLVWNVLRPDSGTASAPGWLVAVAVLSAAASFGIDRLWFLRIPTYIVVANWGVAFYAIGLVLFHRQLGSGTPQRTALVLAAGFLAAGCVLAGLARPPSGLVLVSLSLGVALFYLIKGQRLALRDTVLAGFAFGLLSLGLLALRGLTPAHWWDLWHTASDLRSSYEEQHPFLLWHLKDTTSLMGLRPDLAWGTLIVLISCGLSLLGHWQAFAAKRWLRGLLLGLSAVMLGAMILRLSPLGLALYYNQRTFGAEIIFLALVWISFAIALRQWQSGTLPRHLGLALLCFAGPFIVAFGTGSIWYVQLVNAMSLFGVAIVLVSAQPGRRGLLALASACVAGLALQIQVMGMQSPYRIHGALSELRTEVPLQGLPDDRIKVHPDTAALYLSFQEAAAQGGIEPGTALVDLTGRRPGMAVVLPVTAPVYPWIASGYINSPELLDYIWEAMPAETRAAAWLLGPLHPSFEPSPLAPSFTDLDRCYQRLAQGTEPRTGEPLELWRPRADADPAACFQPFAQE